MHSYPGSILLYLFPTNISPEKWCLEDNFAFESGGVSPAPLLHDFLEKNQDVYFGSATWLPSPWPGRVDPMGGNWGGTQNFLQKHWEKRESVGKKHG